MIQFQRPARPTLGLFEIYGAIGVAAVLTARFVPLARLPGWGCVFRRVVGWPCLTCGMTRSFDWFAQGRFVDSLTINPLGFMLASLATIGVVYMAAAPLRPPRLKVELSRRGGTMVRVTAVALVVSNWAYLVLRTVAGT
jgi:hypothetical protein